MPGGIRSRILERSSRRLRVANARDRRRATQFTALEMVGRLLAIEGPTRGALHLQSNAAVTGGAARKVCSTTQ